jgi:DNA mismatch repair protein MutS
MEDPKKAKGIVEREVVRVVTPGTVVEEELLSASANNYLVAVSPARPRHGLAYVDITTGEFAAAEVTDGDLALELARLAPAEVVLPDGLELPSPCEAPVTSLDGRAFAADEASERLRTHFGVLSLDGYGLRGQGAAVSAAGAVRRACLSRRQSTRLSCKCARPARLQSVRLHGAR